MRKEISPKITALTFGVLAVSFLAAFYVVAWQEPTSAPPAGNVATPLNTGSAYQEKIGPLIINRGGAVDGLIVEKGRLCIGTDCKDKWPETGVVTTLRMEATGYKVYNPVKKYDEYFSKSVSYTCPAGSNVVNIYLTQSMVTLRSASGGACIWGCQVGQCSTWQSNVCSYSISGSTSNTITLKARILEEYEPDCACCVGLSLPDYCYPRSISWPGFSRWSCYIPGQCVTEFQCGTKQTVGQ